MTNFIRHAALAALTLALAGPAAAHEFECERTIGIVLPDQLGQDGLPVFAATPAPLLVVGSYPALVGFEVVLRNVAADPSLINGTSTSLLDGKSAAAAYGATLAAGDVIAPAASATRVVVVPIASYEECLALGGAPDLACRAAGAFDDRFVVTHNLGSSECRARLVCVPQQQL
jgi:hypothetical protein